MKLTKIVALIGATLVCSASTYANGDGPHSVIKVYVASGDPGATLAAGTTVLHSSEVSCPKNLTSCTLALSAMDQICTIDGTINNFRVIVSVDSVNVDEGAGGGTGYDPCDTRSWIGNVSVGPGRHKVVLSTDILISDPSATQQNWSVNYTVTTP